MRHRSATAAAAGGVAALALWCATACAQAAPPKPATPQQDAPCSEAWVRAMTRLADGKTTLVCTDHGGDYRWAVDASPYPLSHRWLTYGPDLSLRGQGMRNPEILSGDWIGDPEDRNGVCSAERVTVLGVGCQVNGTTSELVLP